MKKFDDLCMEFPKLRQIEARAFGYRHEARDAVPCPDFPSIFVEVVLLLKDDPPALELAQWHLLEVLPDCRECACPRSPWLK